MKRESVTEKPSLLDALLVAQVKDGYLSEAVMSDVAEKYDISVTKVYDTASFYSMFRFSPAGRTIIQICHNAPCHIAGAADVIKAFEDYLGISMGETTENGDYTLEYSECIGQCQDSPSILINGEIHTGIKPSMVRELFIEK